MSPDDEPEIWVLTPENISEYCQKSGADYETIMRQYREAQVQNKILHGYIPPRWVRVPRN